MAVISTDQRERRNLSISQVLVLLRKLKDTLYCLARDTCVDRKVCNSRTGTTAVAFLGEPLRPLRQSFCSIQSPEQILYT